MQVKFSFDKAAVERRGHTLETVHRTVKSLFAVHSLPCVSGGRFPVLPGQGPRR